MLPKSRRIERRLFKPLLGSKRYYNSEHFLLRSAFSDTVRITVSVPKKISKKATVRNKIRRRVYAIVEDLIPLLPNRLFHLSAKSGIEMAKGQNLKDELAELLKKG